MAAVEHGADALVALAEEAVVGHPLVVEHARQVAAAGVRVEHDDDVVGCRRLGDADRRRDGHATGAADEDALDLGDAAGGQEALLVADRDDVVVEVAVPGRREEVLTDALDEVRPPGPAGEHRALRVGGDDLDRRVAGLEVAGHARDRPARAGAGDEVGDAAGGLRPQLGPRRLLVRERVGRVGVLVGSERLQLLGEALGHGVVALRVLRGDGDRADDHLGAVRLEQRDLLRRHLVGHHEDAAVAALGGDDGQPDARVAARRLDDRAAGAEQAVALGGQDHLQRRPVLGRAAGVGGLHLHGQHAGDLLDLADPAQPHERGVADQVDHGRGDGRALEAGVGGGVTHHLGWYPRPHGRIRGQGPRGPSVARSSAFTVRFVAPGATNRAVNRTGVHTPGARGGVPRRL